LTVTLIQPRRIALRMTSWISGRSATVSSRRHDTASSSTRGCASGCPGSSFVSRSQRCGGAWAGTITLAISPSEAQNALVPAKTLAMPEVMESWSRRILWRSVGLIVVLLP
jgi:hypothetical protein